MMFLKNCWYLAAWSHDVPTGGMLARQIAGEHVLLLRDASDRIAALAETCPHRFAPLGLGTCAGGVVTCPYHGLRFDASGSCVENPHGPVGAALSLRKFGAVERHAAIWVWLGADAPDESRIPDFGFIDRTAPEARVMDYLHSPSDYRLMVDNIMDLTHADYLHADSLGGGINTRAKATAKRDGDKVVITWTAMDDQLAPAHARALGTSDGRGDFVNQVTWAAPGNMLLRVLLSPPGKMDSDAKDSLTCHVMTPETDRSTHYFFCHTSDGLSANPAMAPRIRAALLHAFADEDSPLVSAQARRIAGRDFWSLRPALLPSDKGGVLVRRAFDAMLAAEAQREKAA